MNNADKYAEEVIERIISWQMMQAYADARAEVLDEELAEARARAKRRKHERSD